MPSASSAAPGQPSSGAAGKTASSTTPTSTTRSNAFSTNTFRRLPNGAEVDTGQLIHLRCAVPREVAETKLGVHWVRTTTENRPDERRGGKGCVSTCRSRRWPYHYTQQNHTELT